MATMAARRVECGRGGGYGSDGDNCVIDLFTINTHTQIRARARSLATPTRGRNSTRNTFLKPKRSKINSVQ